MLIPTSVARFPILRHRWIQELRAPSRQEKLPQNKVGGLEGFASLTVILGVMRCKLQVDAANHGS